MRIHGNERRSLKHNLSLLGLTEKCYMKSQQWRAIRAVVLKLAVNLGKYAAHLEKQAVADKKSNENVPLQ